MIEQQKKLREYWDGDFKEMINKKSQRGSHFGTPRLSRSLIPYAFVFPTVAVLLFIEAFPFFWNIWISLNDVRTTNIMRGYPFVGLKNYMELFKDPMFYHSLHVSLYFVLGSIVGQFMLGLLIALIFNKYEGLARFFRPIFVIPWLLSALIIGYSWIWMYNYNFGLINTILRMIGLKPIKWLNDVKMAVWALVIANVWRGTPFTMLFLESSLKNIPKELYEAARVDGASGWQIFFYITLQLLRPALTINFILVTMWTFNLFDTILVMTQGGPADATMTTAMYMYNNAFKYGLFGYGAAITLVMLIINAALAAVYFKTIGRENIS